MKRKFLIGMLIVVIGVVGIVAVLTDENALVVHPKGIIAQNETGSCFGIGNGYLYIPS